MWDLLFGILLVNDCGHSNKHTQGVSRTTFVAIPARRDLRPVSPAAEDPLQDRTGIKATLSPRIGT